MLKKIILSCMLSISMLFSSFSISLVPVLAATDPTTYDAVATAKIMGATDVFALKAKAALLMDAASGRVLHESNSHEKLSIASVTKIMSMLLVMEAVDSGKIKMTDTVPISSYATSFGGSQLWLDVRESNKYTVKDMLKGIAIHSANDGTVALAEMIAGSEVAFVDLMNKRAKDLGMKDTNFLDCTGLTDDGHYSSAYDIALMSRELILKHPTIFDFTTIRLDKFGEGIREKPTELTNTNPLIGKYDGMNGLKTGFTTKAGFNLSATAKRKDMFLIGVVLGEPDNNTRAAEIQRLLDYGFSNFELTKIASKGDPAGTLTVSKGLKTSVNAVYSDDIFMMLKKGDQAKLVKNVTLEQNLTAPLEVGQKAGTVSIALDGKEITTTDIVTETKVEKASFIRLFFRMVAQWFSMGRK